MQPSRSKAPAHHAEATRGQKWFLAFVLACPPCIAAGLASVGGGLGVALAGLGWWLLGASILALSVAGLVLAVRRRRACAI
jgi:hypothetical protein